MYPSAATAAAITIGVLVVAGLTEVTVKAITGKGFLDHAKDAFRKWLIGDTSAATNQEQITNLPSIAGSKNQNANGRVIPLILGKTYFTPYVLGLPYTTLTGADGCDQTYHALFLIGYKNVKVENVSIGLETLATNSNDDEGALTITSTKYPVSTNNTHNTQLELRRTAHEVDLYPCKVVQENKSVELLNADGTTTPVYGFSARYPKVVEIEIAFQGLVKYDDKGKKKDASVGVKVEYSFDGTNWTAAGNTTGDKWELTNATGTNTYSSGVLTFKNKKTQTMRYVYRREFTYAEMETCASKTVEFRITRTTANSTSTSVIDKCYFTAVRTWCYDASKSNSNDGLVDQVPINEKERDKTARLGFSIKVTEDLEDYFDKINLIATSKARTWDGYGWSKTKTATRNPASLALEIMTGDYLDERYRHDLTEGETYMESSKIDLASLGELFEYSEEERSFGGNITDKRFLCDGAVLNATKKIDLVNSVLQTARSFIVLKGKKYGVFIDKPLTVPLLNLNNNNLLSLTLTKNFDDLPDGQSVKYISALNYYQQDTMVVKPYGSAPLSSNDVLQNLDLPYVTDPYHAKAMSLYNQACQKLRPETLNATVSTEGALAEIGCLIGIQSPVISVGIGEGAEITEVVISSSSITGIKTDAKFTVADTSKDYGVIINTVDSNGTPIVIKKKLAGFSQTGEYNEFTFDSAESSSSPIEEGCIVSFGIYETGYLDTICLGKKENGDGTYDLTLVPYDTAIYTADSTIVHDFDPKVTPPQDSGLPINYGGIETPMSRQDVIETIGMTRDETPPEVPSGLVANATRDYIALQWVVTNNDFVKETIIEINRGDGEGWVEVQATRSNKWNYYFDRDVDGYPEKTTNSPHDLIPDYQFRAKNMSIYGIESEYCTAVNVFADDYKTWILPTITVDTEVSDRLCVLTAVYNGEVYGNIETLLKIKRIGNTDLVDSNRTYNQLLCVQPDEVFYTTDFDDFTGRITTADDYTNYGNTEENYKKNTTTAFASRGNKITHTLPLIGQNPRMYQMGDVPILKSSNPDVPYFAWEIQDSATVPQSPSVGDMFHYTGSTTTQFNNGFYYMYVEGETAGTYVWEQIFAKSLMVPTSYQYQIQMKNEASESNTVTKTIQALPTNIADIVHSHEHYKDLYVEKLSAISANIGLIQQGGFGEFDYEKGNYWALSTLSAEDTGISGGIQKGAFRVGGENEYLRVTPLGNERYKIELKAGNIELTTDTQGNEGMDFFNGTYVYNSDKTQRMALTPSGIIVEEYSADAVTPVGTENPSEEGWYEYVNGQYVLSTDTTVTSGKTYYKDAGWRTLGQVTIDANNNLIISNTRSKPDFGFKVNGNVYHFEDSANKDKAESGTNPQSITVTGDIIDSDNALIDVESSKYVVYGTVTKNVSSFSNKMVFFTKANGVQLDRYFNIDGTTTDTPDTYNSTMSESLGQETVGEYLGLTAQQISDGIFEEIEE